VGIIGMGAIGAVHADSYRTTGEADLVGICDISKERLAAQGERLNVAQRFTDYRDLLHTDVAAVSVCVGNALHREVAVAALRAGKHILLEKPMAMNAREAAEIVAAGQKARKTVQIGMVNRQSPEAQILRDYVQRGRFGKIYHMRAVLIRRRGIPGLGGWFTTKAASGGGPMIDLGVHWFDLALFVSGLWKPTHVSAMTYAKFGRDMQAYRYVGMWAGPPRYDGVCDVEDYSTGLIRFGREATLSFEIAWAANANDEAYIDILGDKGGARFMDGKPLTIFTEQEERLVDVCPKYDNQVNRFVVQAGKFLAACRGECPPAVSAKEGWTIMKLLDGVYASGKTGREIKLA
jgi:predicted dehydrogenase